MCELLAATSKKEFIINDFLNIFFSHSMEHQNGWGLALFDNTRTVIEKEPIKAVDSLLLKKIMENNIKTSRCLAHIRKATIGDINDKNTHPFSKCDDSGRMWTLAHNGTIFDSKILAPYQYAQDGATDSERILLYIVDEMNRYYKENSGFSDANKRMHIVDDAIRNIVPGNKVNLIIYDGEFFYVHKNEPGTMYMKENGCSVIFATQALEPDGWIEAPQNRLVVYKNGEAVYFGQRHNDTYIHNETKMRLLYLAYSKL